MYTVQSILRKRKGEYLVEWYGFPKSEATWESTTNIPNFIIKVKLAKDKIIDITRLF